MELQKILQKANNISSKEEKLTFLMENIWQTMYEGLETRTLDSSSLRFLTVEYAKTSFDANNVPTSYDDLPEEKLAYYDPKKGVVFNYNRFQIEESALDDMHTYATFVKTVSHEFTHRNDEESHRVNKLERDSRFAKGNIYKACLIRLGNIYNDKNFEKLGCALYESSCNEVVARNVSYNFAQNFAKQLRKITNQKLPARETALSRMEQYQKMKEEGIDLNNLSELNTLSDLAIYAEQDFYSKWMHIAIDDIEDTISKYQEVEQDLPYLNNNIINKNLSNAKQAFFAQCNKYLNGQYSEKELENFDPMDMAMLLTKPEFFDKKIGNKLYKYVLNDKSLNNGLSIDTLNELSDIKELDIPKKEREQHKKNYIEYENFIKQLNIKEK